MMVYFNGVGIVEAADLLSGKVLLPPRCVAQTLQRRQRFSGQTIHGHGVLSHSLLVTDMAAGFLKRNHEVRIKSAAKPGAFSDEKLNRFQLLEVTAALWGLWHDVCEVFVGDVAKPIKELLPGLEGIEKKIIDAYREWLTPEIQKQLRQVDINVICHAVKSADMAALHIEGSCLLPAGGREWFYDGPLDDRYGVAARMMYRDAMLAAGRSGAPAVIADGCTNYSASRMVGQVDKFVNITETLKKRYEALVDQRETSTEGKE